jgi:hypothetical protein
MPNEKDLNRRDFLITGAAGLTALGSVAFLGLILAARGS